MNIKCTQNMFKSSNGTNEVTYYILKPEGVELKGVVQFSHGMCEYFSRYTQFAEYLCGLGFVVCGNDHLGHGCTAQKNTDLGFFAPQNGWKYLVDDMRTLADLIKKRYENLPYFVLGHSMGSLITRIFLSTYKGKIDGCILTGTLGPNPFARTGIRLADSIVYSKGTKYRSVFLYKMALGNYNKKIKDHKTSFDWLSRDERVVERYLSDEKCNFLFTSSGYRDLFMLAFIANSVKCYKSTPKQLPILIISGDKDPVGTYGEGVKKVVHLYRSAGVKKTDLIFYKDGRHEMLNETNSHEVFGDISRWLEQELSKKEAVSKPVS